MSISSDDDSYLRNAINASDDEDDGKSPCGGAHNLRWSLDQAGGGVDSDSTEQTPFLILAKGGSELLSVTDSQVGRWRAHAVLELSTAGDDEDCGWKALASLAELKNTSSGGVVGSSWGMVPGRATTEHIGVLRFTDPANANATAYAKYLHVRAAAGWPSVYVAIPYGSWRDMKLLAPVHVEKELWKNTCAMRSIEKFHGRLSVSGQSVIDLPPEDPLYSRDAAFLLNAITQRFSAPDLIELRRPAGQLAPGSKMKSEEDTGCPVRSDANECNVDEDSHVNSSRRVAKRARPHAKVATRVPPYEVAFTLRLSVHDRCETIDIGPVRYIGFDKKKTLEDIGLSLAEHLRVWWTSRANDTPVTMNGSGVVTSGALRDAQQVIVMPSTGPHYISCAARQVEHFLSAFADDVAGDV